MAMLSPNEENAKLLVAALRNAHDMKIQTISSLFNSILEGASVVDKGSPEYQKFNLNLHDFFKNAASLLTEIEDAIYEIKNPGSSAANAQEIEELTEQSLIRLLSLSIAKKAPHLNVQTLMYVGRHLHGRSGRRIRAAKKTHHESNLKTVGRAVSSFDSPAMVVIPQDSTSDPRIAAKTKLLELLCRRDTLLSAVPSMKHKVLPWTVSQASRQLNNAMIHRVSASSVSIAQRKFFSFPTALDVCLSQNAKEFSRQLEQRSCLGLDSVMPSSTQKHNSGDESHNMNEQLSVGVSEPTSQRAKCRERRDGSRGGSYFPCAEQTPAFTALNVSAPSNLVFNTIHFGIAGLEYPHGGL